MNVWITFLSKGQGGAGFIPGGGGTGVIPGTAPFMTGYGCKQKCKKKNNEFYPKMFRVI